MNIVRTLFGLFLGRRLPRHRGEISVSGCNGRVTIRRDGYGVPYISADNDDDVWFGLGFCHGQDRAGQLELTLRTIRGTLSEVAGPDMVGLDRLCRRIGFRRAAESQLEATDEATRRQHAAYARGVNEGMRRGADRPAHELALLRIEPTLWEAADVQGLLVLLAFALASNWDIELVRMKVLALDGPEALAALDPAYPYWLPMSSPPGALAGEAVDRLKEDVQVLSQLVGALGASNAWAVSAEKTSTGRPILSCDPHLNPIAPSQWYLTRLSTPDWSSAGVTFVGVPSIAIGHNGFAAWGITAAHADNTDLFMEEIGPDRCSVRSAAGFEQCDIREETILVKGQEPVIETILETPRGPIVSPVLDDNHSALSLSATWLAPRPYVGLLGIHKVSSATDFRALFEPNSVSTAGIVYADASDTLAWQMAVSLPIRKKGFGTLPLPGWDPEVGWTDELVPHEQLPFEVDPSEGFVASANNKPTTDVDGPFLGVDWLDGYRQAAIVESLRERDDWDVPSHMALQLETRSLPWQQMRGAVLAIAPKTELASEGLALLEAWDGRVSADSVGASVFELFVAEMCQRVVRAKAPRSAVWQLGRGFSDLLPYNLLFSRRLGHLVDLLERQPVGFFDVSWASEISDALHEVMKTLRDLASRPEQRAWGNIRQFVLPHPFGEKAPLDRIFNLGPYPGCGDASTIHQGSVDLSNPTANVVGLPTARAVIDLGDWDASRFVVLGGQSGNPFSPNYEDQAPLWQAGEGIAIHWSDEAVSRATTATLRLIPDDC